MNQLNLKVEKFKLLKETVGQNLCALACILFHVTLQFLSLMVLNFLPEFIGHSYIFFYQLSAQISFHFKLNHFVPYY